MSYKTRLFVLDEAAQREMLEDLRDSELLAYYWENTGDVASDWVSDSAFRKHFPQVPIPQDCALYDRSPLIVYDEERQILGFDVVDENSSPVRIFSDLQQLVQSHSAGELAEIPRVAAEAEPAAP